MMIPTHPLRQLDELDEDLEAHSGYTGVSRWIIPYADFLTLLLGFFVILFAMTQIENHQITSKKSVNQQAFTKVLQEKKLAETEVRALKSALIKTGKNPAQVLQALAETASVSVAQAPDLSLKDLEESLGKKLNLKGQQITVSQDYRGIVISFQERIFFQPGKAVLSRRAEQTLDKLASILIQIHRPIRVEGHTDNTPIKTSLYPSNWELSTARATVIVRNLIERHRFDPRLLSAAGYAQYEPLDDNSTIEGKQKNRRVDIVLLNPLSGFSASQSHPLSKKAKTPSRSSH